MTAITDDTKLMPGGSDRSSTPEGSLSVLALTALGIVFGDIGTSPLYTFKTVLSLAGGGHSPEMAMGLLSLLVWTLILTTSVKYVAFVMRVDNDGEGGILALMSLLGERHRKSHAIIFIGLFGAALIYGDGVITPAISVLSALEGVEIATPAITPWVLPAAVVILLGLFAIQPQGTARIGRVFGPVMSLWFVVIAALGLYGISLYPGILWALNPAYAVGFLAHAGITGFMVLGGVFLAVTGAEALYADMGHVGARPIRLAWYGLVLPSLVLNYAGQAALLASGAPTGDNIFYRLCPSFLLIPLIALATLATIIASQSIITGAFSMTRQAIQLGWLPRMRIKQTSATGYGQIYVSAVNWTLMVATIALAVSFGSSDALASAYGIAVATTMMLTTILLFIAMREIWHWPLVLAGPVAACFFIIDFVFFSANALKFLEGGWVPLALALAIYTLMIAWHRGNAALHWYLDTLTEPVPAFLARIAGDGTARVPGTAVFLTKTRTATPPLMIWHVQQNRALHQKILVLTAATASVPWIAAAKRSKLEKLAPDFWRVTTQIGFMETLDIPVLLRHLRDLGCTLDLDDVTYYVGHETVLPRSDGTGMPRWQAALFSLMTRNAAHVTDFLKLPRDAVVELGRQIEI